MQQHDGVGAHGPNVPTGSEALRVFFGQPSTRVGADQKPVGAAGGGNVLGRVRGHPVEPTIEPECAGNSQHEYRNQGPGQAGEATAGSESGQPEITPVTPRRLVSGRLAALLPLLGASLRCALLAARAAGALLGASLPLTLPLALPSGPGSALPLPLALPLLAHGRTIPTQLLRFMVLLGFGRVWNVLLWPAALAGLPLPGLLPTTTLAGRPR